MHFSLSPAPWGWWCPHLDTDAEGKTCGSLSAFTHLSRVAGSEHRVLSGTGTAEIVLEVSRRMFQDVITVWLHSETLPRLQIDEGWELLLTPAPGAQVLLDGLLDSVAAQTRCGSSSPLQRWGVLEQRWPSSAVGASWLRDKIRCAFYSWEPLLFPIIAATTAVAVGNSLNYMI